MKKISDKIVEIFKNLISYCTNYLDFKRGNIILNIFIVLLLVVATVIIGLLIFIVYSILKIIEAVYYILIVLVALYLVLSYFGIDVGSVLENISK